ncbi:MAG TPA: hypothetical protein VG897_09950, partial [Terriglobales bacterium]|nr:hypothetical protein [Terriglobales bacterium]
MDDTVALGAAPVPQLKKHGTKRLILLAAAAFAAVLVPLYLFAISRPSVGIIHDDGIYTVTAKSLAEGRGFRIESLPDNPAQTKYGPVYVAVLAFIWRLFPCFPTNLLLLKMTTAAFLIPWMCCSYAALTRLFCLPREAAAWICVITASLPWCITSAASLMSDLPFAVLVMLSILCFGRAESTSHITMRLASACALAAASAYLTRSAGLAVILGGAGIFFPLPRLRPVLVYLGISGAAIGGWIAWQFANADSYTLPALRYYTADNYHDWNAILAGAPLEKVILLV